MFADAFAHVREHVRDLFSAPAVDLPPPVTLPERLAELTADRVGTVQAPVWLYWSGKPNQEFDLANDADAATWYEAVIGRGTTADQVKYLNGVRLAELWTIIQMPWKTRMAWESRYPELRTIRLAARAAERDQGLPAAA